MKAKIPKNSSKHAEICWFTVITGVFVAFRVEDENRRRLLSHDGIKVTWYMYVTVFIIHKDIYCIKKLKKNIHFTFNKKWFYNLDCNSINIPRV